MWLAMIRRDENSERPAGGLAAGQGSRPTFLGVAHEGEDEHLAGAGEGGFV